MACIVLYHPAINLTEYFQANPTISKYMSSESANSVAGTLHLLKNKFRPIVVFIQIDPDVILRLLNVGLEFNIAMPKNTPKDKLAWLLRLVDDEMNHEIIKQVDETWDTINTFVDDLKKHDVIHPVWELEAKQSIDLFLEPVTTLFSDSYGVNG